jgi:tetratricopeptide (TPR) repeat protein
MITEHDDAGRDHDGDGLEKLGLEHYAQGRYAEAEAVLGLVLERRRKEGRDRPSVASTLNNLGLVHKAQGRYAKAEALYRDALAIRETTLGPSHPEVGSGLNNLGELCRVQGRHDEAERHFRRALSIHEGAPESKHPDVAHSLNGLALLRWKRGEFREAEGLFMRALAILRAAYGPDHAEVGVLLANLAELERVQGRSDEAERLLRDALAIAEKVLGPDHPGVGDTLDSLASLLRDQGRFDEAEKAFARALAILETACGPDHPDVVGALNNLGVLLRMQGRYREAEPLYQRALAIAGTSPNLDPLLLIVTLNNLALVYRSEGRHRDAEPLYQRAVDTSEKILGPSHHELATMLNNLAGVYWAEQRFAEAEPLYRRALTILEQALGPSHPDTATTMSNLAALSNAQGRNEEALRLLHCALVVLEKTLGSDHPDTARCFHNLGLVCKDAGRLGEAEGFYQRALAAREKVLGPEHPDLAATLHNMAALREMQGRHADGLCLARRATAIGRRRAIVTGASRAASTMAEQSSLGGRYRFHLALLAGAVGRVEIGERRGAEEGFELAQLALANRTERAIARMTARFAAGDGALARLARGREEALDRRDAAEQALMHEISKPSELRRTETEAHLRSRIAQAEADVAGLDAALLEQFPKYVDLLGQEPLGLTQAQALLSAEEALVAYVVGENATYAVLLRCGDARLLPLQLGAQALADRVSALRSGVEPHRSGVQPGDGHATGTPRDLAAAPGTELGPLRFDVEEACQLYKEIWAPIEPFLAGVKHVFVVPDKALESLPLHMLVTEPPTSKLHRKEDLRNVQWLARKEYALAMLPSARALNGLRELAARTPRGTGFIGFGDPAFAGVQSPDLSVVTLDWRGTVNDLDGLRSLRPLPESAGELEELARSLGAPRTALFLGPRATERQVRALDKSKDLAQAGVLAFATHGLMAGEINGLNEPGLVLTPPEKPSEEDDGFLAASEIATLDLNADWVLLSACNTAAADGAPGAEGFSGLARAFFYAGARTLLVSHWSVYSAAAVALTTGAFDQLRQAPSIGRAEALRRSMVNVIDHGPDPSPRYWAPFVVVGDAGI